MDVDPAAVIERHTLHTSTGFRDSWGDIPRCDFCVGRWSGDAETGGCRERLLAFELTRLRVDAAPPITAAEQAALDRLGEEVAGWKNSQAERARRNAGPLVWLAVRGDDAAVALALARRAGAAATPRDHAGGEES